MQTWQLQDAKSHFSQVVDITIKQGPQLVTRRGQDAVVILSASDYRRMIGVPSLLSTLLSGPRGAPLILDRSQEPIREVDL
ncbi:MAG: type II toxin-antitoxin system Phd/YefM family antitoxin [Burkholderiaceae bacterium]